MTKIKRLIKTEKPNLLDAANQANIAMLYMAVEGLTPTTKRVKEFVDEYYRSSLYYAKRVGIYKKGMSRDDVVYTAISSLCSDLSNA